MGSRRVARIAQAIKEEVSTAILFELRDPRIKHVTVLDVEVSGDLRSAKVHVSVMGEPKDQALTMHGLNSARGFLQSKVGDRVQTRWTPILTFVLDQGVKKSIEAARILRETFAQDQPADVAQETGGDAPDWDDEAPESEEEIPPATQEHP